MDRGVLTFKVKSMQSVAALVVAAANNTISADDGRVQCRPSSRAKSSRGYASSELCVPFYTYFCSL